jgi:hypothetical protein
MQLMYHLPNYNVIYAQSVSIFACTTVRQVFPMSIRFYGSSPLTSVNRVPGKALNCTQSITHRFMLTFSGRVHIGPINGTRHRSGMPASIKWDR